MAGVRFRRKPKHVRVRAEWYGLWPARGRSYRFWAMVGRRVAARRVAHGDHFGVQQICAEVEAELNGRGL